MQVFQRENPTRCVAKAHAMRSKRPTDNPDPIPRPGLLVPPPPYGSEAARNESAKIASYIDAMLAWIAQRKDARHAD